MNTADALERIEQLEAENEELKTELAVVVDERNDLAAHAIRLGNLLELAERDLIECSGELDAGERNRVYLMGRLEKTEKAVQAARRVLDLANLDGVPSA